MRLRERLLKIRRCLRARIAGAAEPAVLPEIKRRRVDAAAAVTISLLTLSP